MASSIASQVQQQAIKEVFEVLIRLKEDIRQELTEQGHVLTGSLINNIELKVKTISDGILGEIYMLDYWEDLETGVKPEDLPSNHQDRLLDYFTARGVDDPDMAALNTLRVHFKTGIPTAGSYEYTNNGRRTGFLSHVVEERREDITELLSQSDLIVQAINTIISKNK